MVPVRVGTSDYKHYHYHNHGHDSYHCYLNELSRNYRKVGAKKEAASEKRHMLIRITKY